MAIERFIGVSPGKGLLVETTWPLFVWTWNPLCSVVLPTGPAIALSTCHDVLFCSEFSWGQR